MFGNMIKDNGNLVLSTNEAMAFTIKFDHYKAMVIKDGVLVDYDISEKHTDVIIIGYDKNNRKRNDIIEPNVLYNDRNILDSLISLSQCFNIDNVLIWCNKHGLPFLEMDIYKRYKKHGFTFMKLWTESGDLVSCFMQANSILNIDIGVEVHNKKRTSGVVLRKGLTTNEMSEEICYLLNRAKVTYNYNYKNDRFVLEVGFGDLVSLAVYQFAVLLMSPDEMTITKCKLCGSLFPAYSKKEKYCHNPCYPQLAYKRKKATNNGSTENK